MKTRHTRVLHASWLVPFPVVSWQDKVVAAKANGHRRPGTIFSSLSQLCNVERQDRSSPHRSVTPDSSEHCSWWVSALSSQRGRWLLLALEKSLRSFLEASDYPLFLELVGAEIAKAQSINSSHSLTSGKAERCCLIKM